MTAVRFWPCVVTSWLAMLPGTFLYNWYGGDFVQVAGSTTDFAARYSPELKQALDIGSPPIEWLPYDWKLNSLANEQSR